MNRCFNNNKNKNPFVISYQLEKNQTARAILMKFKNFCAFYYSFAAIGVNRCYSIHKACASSSEYAIIDPVHIIKPLSHIRINLFKWDFHMHVLRAMKGSVPSFSRTCKVEWRFDRNVKLLPLIYDNQPYETIVVRNSSENIVFAATAIESFSSSSVSSRLSFVCTKHVFYFDTIIRNLFNVFFSPFYADTQSTTTLQNIWFWCTRPMRSNKYFIHI